MNTWIARLEADTLARWEDKSRAPQTTVRKAWRPVMVEISHLPTRHPDAGGLRLWSLRGTRALSVRTVERIMAINRRIYTDIPGTAPPRYPQAEPQPHPFKAPAAHAYWLIDGRLLDFALAGPRWWSLIILAGSARTLLAGAVAPSEASWVARTVLSTAGRRYGVPEHVSSDSGGACISEAFAGVCTRLGIDHKTLVSTEGQSDMQLMETPCNIQRRLDDSQVAWTRTPLEFAEAHPRFRELYTPTAHQGLLTAQLASPLPLHVLGDVKGRLYTPQERARQFAHALWPRTTNRYGCVTLPSNPCYVDQGLPQQQGLLGAHGQERRAVCDQVLFAKYHCPDALRAGKVTAIRVSQG
jgi:hypothetical protein